MTPTIADSESLNRFTTNPAPILEKLRQDGQPLLLTADGEGDIVVQDAASYRRLLGALDRLETVERAKEGLQDVAAGRTRPMREVLADLARKYDLPPVEGE